MAGHGCWEGLAADPMGEDGRGLLIVRALSACTGVTGDARGRVMWADVLWTGYPDGTPPS